MKPGNPWSVKGIQPAARQAAKDAARRHGMTLGQWLNHVIMDNNEEKLDAAPEAVLEQQPKRQRPAPYQQPPQVHVAPQPQVEPQVAPQATAGPSATPQPKSQHLHDKIEDLAAKLDSIVNSQSAKRAQNQWEDDSSSAQKWGDIAVENSQPDVVTETIRPLEPQAPSKSKIFGDRMSALTEKLDSIVQARADTKSRADENMMELETALRNVINHIEVSDRQNTDVMKSIQARLSELSSRTALSNNSTMRQLTGSISEMEERLSHMSQRLTKSETETNVIAGGVDDKINELAGGVDDKINTLATRLDKSLNQGPEPQFLALQEHTKRIASQLDEVLQASKNTAAADKIDTRFAEISDRIKHTEQQHVTGIEQQYSKLSALEDSINQLFEAVEQNRTLTKENVFNASQKSFESIEKMEAIAEQAALKAAENAAQRSAEHVAAIMADDGLNKKEVTASLVALRGEMHQLQESTIEAAQRSVEESISVGISSEATKAIAEPMMALRQAFDQLQDSSKNTEIRNQETLEAVHDTLEKVVERLVALETAPEENSERSPLPSLSMPEMNLVPSSEFEPPLETPEENANLSTSDTSSESAEDVTKDASKLKASPATDDVPFPWQQEGSINRDQHSPVAAIDAPETENDDSAAPTLNHNFLDAARRAAQAASQMPRNIAESDNTEETEEGESSAKSGLLAMATKSENKRKTLLLMAAAVLLIIGALSAGSLMTNKSSTVASAKISPPAIITGAIEPTKTTSKSNKVSAQEKIAAAPKTVKSATSSPLQKTAQTKNREMTQQTTPALGSKPQSGTRVSEIPIPASSTQTRPRIETSAATVNELTGTNQVEKPSGAVKVTRLVATPTNQPAVMSDAPPARTSAPLPPEAIGPLSLRQAAADGDAKAQFEVAARYTVGKLVPQNFSKAISWYQKAAAQGLAPAQYRLGTFYEKGRGVAEDKPTARTWYERAAAQGNLKAIHNLAVIHADGSKGKPDFAKAGLWFRKAAELGLADSQYNLAILHDRGLGVSKDQSTAYFWFRIAGRQGDKDAEARAAVIEKRLSPDQIARTKLLVSNWTPTTLNKSANEVEPPFDSWQPISTTALETPTTVTATATTSSPFTQKELVILTQGYLAKLGFNPGPADGILGTQTRDAIEDFQQQNALPVSGIVSPGLVRELKSAAG